VDLHDEAPDLAAAGAKEAARRADCQLAERERHWQVQHLFGHHLFREGDDLPTLIVGDFNDWRNTLAAGPFASHRYEQVTAPPSRFRSFPAYLSVGALDKAFFRGGLTVRHARIVRTVGARVASDHLPLAIDFHLGSTPLDAIVERAPKSEDHVAIPAAERHVTPGDGE
jgi:endonuclease/exonuclease/phosphatase (EEP) superfamily protein YafD